MVQHKICTKACGASCLCYKSHAFVILEYTERIIPPNPHIIEAILLPYSRNASPPAKVKTNYPIICFNHVFLEVLLLVSGLTSKSVGPLPLHLQGMPWKIQFFTWFAVDESDEPVSHTPSWLIILPLSSLNLPRRNHDWRRLQRRFVTRHFILSYTNNHITSTLLLLSCL